MRIVFVSPYRPAKDGVGRYTENLLQGFKELNSEVNFSVEKWNYLNKFKRIFMPFIWWRATGKRLSRFDIIHIQYVASLYLWHLWLSLGYAQRLNPNVKIVLTLHEANDNTTPKWFFDWLQSFYLKMADKIIVHTNYHANLLPAHNHHKIILIPMAVPNVEESKSNKERHTILLPGFINWWKGHDVAIRALSDLIPIFNDVRLIIVGKPHDKKYFQELLQLVDKLKLQSYVVFEDKFVNDQKFEEYFDTSDIILLPYRRITMSAVLAQAIAHKSTVVMSDLAPLKEYTGNRGIYFKTGDASDLKNVIKQVWQNQNLYQRNQVLMTHLKQKYSCSNIASKTFELHKTLA